MGISPLTLQCRAVVPSLHSTSSREVGWQSLLLDVHTGVSSTDPYTSVPTPDPRIGVTISGRYSFDYLMRGRWRHDQHGPGTICVHRTGQAERYRFPQPTDPMFTLALIYLPLDTLESALDEVRRPGQWSKIPTLHNIVDRDPAITQLALALMEASRNGESDFYAEASAAWLAVHVLSRYCSTPLPEENRRAGAISDQRLARVVELISSHYAEPLSLDRLATEACVSKFHFTRLFREKMGQTPHRYLNEVRLEAARRMLMTTDMSPSQIATLCGFRSASRFAMAFSKRFGASPRTYRSMT